MKTKNIVGILMVAIGMLIVSCSAGSGERQDLVTYSRIVGVLEAKGFDVKSLDTIKQPFFKVDSKVYDVEGDELHILEYAEESDAEEDAKKVSPDGASIGTSMVSWISQPHFFQRQKVIVIYLGDNKEITATLESLMNKQFAGASQEESQAMEKTIETTKGQLRLKYDNGNAVLSGTLERSTPCVNWSIEAITSKDLPISNVNINIFNKNKDAICIQVLGEPQDIMYKIQQVSEITEYLITIENHVVFAGTIS